MWELVDTFIKFEHKECISYKTQSTLADKTMTIIISYCVHMWDVVESQCQPSFLRWAVYGSHGWCVKTSCLLTRNVIRTCKADPKQLRL